MSPSANDGGVHLLLFPFPARSHATPMLHLAPLLLDRGFRLTILITPPHLQLVQSITATAPIETLVLSPPEAPSTPGLFQLVAFMNSLRQLRDPIRQWFLTHPSPPVAIVSDFFLGWTHALAAELGVPRIVFWTSAAKEACALNTMFRDLPKVRDPDDDNSVLHLPDVPNNHRSPWWQISPIYKHYKEGDPQWEAHREGMLGNIHCWGAIVNTCEEMERDYFSHVKKMMGHDRVWAIGPLLPPEKERASSAVDGETAIDGVVMEWLGHKREHSVVYLCFGSLFKIGDQQVGALADSLERSGVNFIWVVKEEETNTLPAGFEDRVAGRGFVLKGWAPQTRILTHKAVGAFVSHCGWSSVLEAVMACVLLLTWPLGADQFLNANLLVDELGVAIRFYDDGSRGVPDAAEMAQLLVDSVGERRPDRWHRAQELGEKALQSVRHGSSMKSLEELVEKLAAP